MPTIAEIEANVDRWSALAAQSEEELKDAEVEYTSHAAELAYWLTQKLGR